jgi:hypothetical protein
LKEHFRNFNLFNNLSSIKMVKYWLNCYYFLLQYFLIKKFACKSFSWFFEFDYSLLVQKLFLFYFRIWLLIVNKIWGRVYSRNTLMNISKSLESEYELNNFKFFNRSAHECFSFKIIFVAILFMSRCKKWFQGNWLLSKHFLSQY